MPKFTKAPNSQIKPKYQNRFPLTLGQTREEKWKEKGGIHLEFVYGFICRGRPISAGSSPEIWGWNGEESQEIKGERREKSKLKETEGKASPERDSRLLTRRRLAASAVAVEPRRKWREPIGEMMIEGGKKWGSKHNDGEAEGGEENNDMRN